jgi:hypothetical protein
MRRGESGNCGEEYRHVNERGIEPDRLDARKPQYHPRHAESVEDHAQPKPADLNEISVAAQCKIEQHDYQKGLFSNLPSLAAVR